MKIVISSLLKYATLWFFMFISLKSSGQKADSTPSYSNQVTTQSDKSSNAEQISNNDLIKLATNAPVPERFESEKAYYKAKNDWIKEHPNAYYRIIDGEKRSLPISAISDTVSHISFEEKRD